jgi:hypothetical protein
VLSKFIKQPITEAFPDMKTFLEHKMVNAAASAPALEAKGVALWQLPQLSVDKLESRCGLDWIVAERIHSVASRYDPN